MWIENLIGILLALVRRQPESSSLFPIGAPFSGMAVQCDSARAAAYGEARIRRVIDGYTNCLCGRSLFRTPTIGGRCLTSDAGRAHCDPRRLNMQRTCHMLNDRTVWPWPLQREHRDAPNYWLHNG